MSRQDALRYFFEAEGQLVRVHSEVDQDLVLAGIARRFEGGKAVLFERFAAALAFPDWFGANWDALEDCLGDLSWRPDAGRLLVIDGFETLQGAGGDDFRVLLGLLGDVAQDWAAEGRAFFAIFVDPRRGLTLRDWNAAGA